MEKYPKKRAYAVGKLYKFLKEKGLYKRFAFYCKTNNRLKGQKNSEDFEKGFLWHKTYEGFDFWHNVYLELLKKENGEQI